MHNQLKDFEAYIFDLDGTLIDSSPVILDCFKKSCEKCAVEIDGQSLTSKIIGPPIREIAAQAGIVDENIDDIIKEFRLIYDHLETDKSVPFDMVYELLNYLKAQNKKLFIATNKPKTPTLRVLKQLNMEFFDEILTIDSFAPKTTTKQEMINIILSNNNIAKERALMIGDSMADINGAIGAKIQSVALLCGYEQKVDELASKADYVFKDIPEFYSALQNKELKF